MRSCDGHQMRPERRGLVQLPHYTNREYCVAEDITLSACTERKKFYVTVTPRSHLRHTARTSEMFDSTAALLRVPSGCGKLVAISANDRWRGNDPAS
jgi:hypothetical protein